MYDGDSWVDPRPIQLVKYTSLPTLSVYEQMLGCANELSADELKYLIRIWLDADNPCHWGTFERLLDAILEI